MQKISIEVINGTNIEDCRQLCNELMEYQKSKAHIFPEVFDMMNFDTRMKPSYEQAVDSQIIVVKDDGIPVGYAFSTIDAVTEQQANMLPPFIAPGEDILGFYPKWLELPQSVGCLSNLYLQEKYQGLGLGKKLLNMSLEWLESNTDIKYIFVYISNGNDSAYEFYIKNGFEFSHDVFGGFIKAAYKEKN